MPVWSQSPVNGLAPEVQLISKGMQFDWPTVGGESFVDESIFFAGSGADNYYSMQYQSNWEDADGSWTNRKVGTGTSTVMGPARAGAWWHLGKLEPRPTPFFFAIPFSIIINESDFFTFSR